MSEDGGAVGAIARRVRRHLEERRAAMVELLERLVEAESPTSEPGAQAEIHALLGEAFEARGCRVRRWAGRTSDGQLLVRPARRERGRPFQLLLGHTDTVWSTGTLREMPLRRSAGRLYGPGAYDMKGGLVEIVFAFGALAELGLDAAVTPVAFLNSDEETGSADSADRIRLLARRADRVLVLEPALGPGGKLKTARKGNGHFRIRVEGRAAHAGLEPEKGASAILELSHLIQRLFALNDPDRGVTVNVGTIDGGVRPNVIAPQSEATVDVRILSREDARRVEKQIRSLEPTTPGTRLSISGGINRLPLERTPRNRMLWHMAEGVATRLGLDIEEGISGGGSDGNITSLLAPTLDGLGPIGDGAHAAHEHVRIASLSERAALLTLLLLEPPLALRRRGAGREAEVAPAARAGPA